MAGGSREPGRTVTSKVLAILEAFEKSRGALSLTDIAEKSGLPLSTTHRLVNELTDWGFLSREPNGRYQLGIRLWELAQNTGRQLRDAAQPLRAGPVLPDRGNRAPGRPGRATKSSILTGSTAPRRVPRASRVGGRLPMHATAVGKVILAFEEDWVRDAYLNRHLERPTAHTHVDPRRLPRSWARSGSRVSPPPWRRCGWVRVPSPSRCFIPAGSAPASDWCCRRPRCDHDPAPAGPQGNFGPDRAGHRTDPAGDADRRAPRAADLTLAHAVPGNTKAAPGLRSGGCLLKLLKRR